MPGQLPPTTGNCRFQGKYAMCALDSRECLSYDTGIKLTWKAVVGPKPAGAVWV